MTFNEDFKFGKINIKTLYLKGCSKFWKKFSLIPIISTTKEKNDKKSHINIESFKHRTKIINILLSWTNNDT